MFEICFDLKQYKGLNRQGKTKNRSFKVRTLTLIFGVREWTHCQVVSVSRFVSQWNVALLQDSHHQHSTPINEIALVRRNVDKTRLSRLTMYIIHFWRDVELQSDRLADTTRSRVSSHMYRRPTDEASSDGNRKKKLTTPPSKGAIMRYCDIYEIFYNIHI
jgi:hypothetical protein